MLVHVHVISLDQAKCICKIKELLLIVITYFYQCLVHWVDKLCSSNGSEFRSSSKLASNINRDIL